jgi:hypothetical protein
MVEKSLLGVVREALAVVIAQKSLPGDHYFYISFNTNAHGVKIPEQLLAKYPEDMTIVLQHQFENLELDDYNDTFSVSLSFDGALHRLTVPFMAITSFVDPHVNFVIYFNIQHKDTDPPPKRRRKDNPKVSNVIPISSLRKDG